MKLRLFALFIFSFLSSFLLAKEKQEFTVHLKNPEFSDGTLKTEKGGVIEALDLRIQAEKISYTNTIVDDCPIQKIKAEGDLMLEYKGKVFVGDKMEFDLLTRTGILWGGKTSVDIWYIGGEKIYICEDGSFTIQDGFVTTCEDQHNIWEIRSDHTEVTKDRLLYTKDIRIQVAKIPIFFWPAYKSNLKRVDDPPFRYRLLWDKGLGPRLSLRYRLYSWETFQTFLRFDYRITRGPGGAIEAEYHSKDMLTYFATKNYGALDKSFPNEQGNTRFRFQGLLTSRSEDDKTHLRVQWDRLSDDRMVSDFKSTDFEINTEQATYLLFTHFANDAFGMLSVRPRINRFQSLNQEIPYVVSGIRPFEIYKTGIISENYASTAYFDYTYVNQLDKIILDRKSGRLETKNSLYRPISLKWFTLTPQIGLVGIFYTDNPQNDSIGQLVYAYGGTLESRFSKQYISYKHTIEPYVSYLGYSNPQAPVDNYFVFDINDGYARLDQVRFGIRQLFFVHNRSYFLPKILLDLYGYAFFGARSFSQTIPKIFADLTVQNTYLALYGNFGVNLQEKVLDYGNARLLWTINSAFALGLEFRHRSKFDWRKADHRNFVVDFARPLSELLLSPLSDRRNTFLTKAHIRFSPRWSMDFQSHHGWGRKNEPHYNGVKVSLYTMITCSWQMRLTYEYAPNDPFRFSYNFNIVK